MIPLDDLLPTNDDSFEPVPSGKFFDTGSPFWEFADIFKWGNKSTEQNNWSWAFPTVSHPRFYQEYQWGNPRLGSPND